MNFSHLRGGGLANSPPPQLCRGAEGLVEQLLAMGTVLAPEIGYEKAGCSIRARKWVKVKTG